MQFEKFIFQTYVPREMIIMRKQARMRNVLRACGWFD